MEEHTQPEQTASTRPDRTAGPVDLDRAGRLLLFTLIGLLSTYLLLALLSYPFGRDQGTFSVVARTMLEGGIPYRDAWDHKTPGIFLAFALAQGLFGESMLSIRLLEAIGLLLLGWSFVRFSARRMGSPVAGFFGAACAWYYHVQMDFWHTAQAESFAAFCLAGALLLTDRILDAPRARGGSYLALGWLIGWTGLLKPHLAAAFAVLLAPIAWRLWRETRSPAAWLGRASLLAAGVLAVLGPIALYFVANDAWDDLIRTVVAYNSGHVALTWGAYGFAEVLGRGLLYLARFITPFGWIGLLLCLYRNHDRDQQVAIGLVAGLIGVLFLGVLLQGKLIKYHYGAIFPLYGLLIGWGWWRFWAQGGGSWQRSLAVIAAFALIPSSWGSSSHFHGRNGIRLKLLLDPEHSLEYVSALYRHDDFHMGENVLVADWIRRHTRETDEVYIWGFEPVLYFMSGRPLASRYLFNVPMRAAWSKQEYRSSLMQELGGDAPELLIVMSGDVFPWVSGNDLDSRHELAGFAELRELLSSRYALAEQIGDFAIFVRRPEVDGVASR